MELDDFVAVMDRVRDAALRVPASPALDEAVYGIEQAAAWAATVAQRGGAVAPAAVIERARSAARVYGGASMARPNQRYHSEACQARSANQRAYRKHRSTTHRRMAVG